MPEILLILWLPCAIAFMAVTWVVTLGAIGQTPAIIEETRVAAHERERSTENREHNG